MNANHILSRWRRVRDVLQNRSFWFLMLHIAEAGKRGLSRAEMQTAAGIKAASLTYSIGKLRRGGLVKEWTGEKSGPGKAPLMASITPEGLEFLGLNPMPETSTEEAAA